MATNAPFNVMALRAVSFQQVTVSTAVLSLVIPGGITPKRVLLTVHSNAIRVRWDGVDPTTTVGHQLPAGPGAASDAARGYEILGINRITRFRMIRFGAADAECAYTIET